ncbi:hypothetical protein H9X78_10620 [Clostridium saudiense]|nr:hypothetical protein [Clostridium saudiense]
METEERKSNEEKKTVRDTLYGRIDVSVKTMDKVIVGLMIALAVSIILGVII